MSKSLITWNEGYSVGNEEIDSQHKVLVGMINKLYDAFLEAKAYEAIFEILDEMIDYTQQHFNFEHKIFEKYNYPNTEEHKEIHKQFVMKTIDFKEKISAGKKRVTYDIMLFLRDWLVQHIQGEDSKYASYFKEFGVGGFH